MCESVPHALVTSRHVVQHARGVRHVCLDNTCVHVLGSSGCLDSHCLPSGMLLQRWPSSPDCQQNAVSSARFVPRHWTVPGTLGQANWTCVMKLITHMHAHTHAAAVVRSSTAEFITAIYYHLLYQRNVICLCVSDACVTLSLWSIIGRWQRWSGGCWWILVLGPAVITPSFEWSVRDTSYKMAAVHQHGSGCVVGVNDSHLTIGTNRLTHTFVWRSRMFGIIHTIATNSHTAMISVHLHSRVYGWAIFTHDIYLTVLFRGNIKEIYLKKKTI